MQKREAINLPFNHMSMIEAQLYLGRRKEKDIESRPMNIHSVGAARHFSPDFHDRILKPVHNSIKDVARDFLTLI